MRWSLSPVLLLALLSGCPSSPPPSDSQRTAELADKLVSCQNERSALKERLAGAQAELTRLKGQPTPAAPAAAPRAGRAGPRAHAGAASKDVIAARPVVPRGPENPAAEARAAQEAAQKLKASVALFKPCYERGLKRNANLQFVTQVHVRLTVTPEGAARDVRLSPKTESDMEACIAHAISRWHFTPYRGQPVVVDAPVSLRVQAM
jgi:hypothetical protein